MNHALEVRGLRVALRARPDTVLVQDVSFALAAGEALTLLGESGSGKSLLAQAIMGTLPDELEAAGEVCVDGDTTAARQGHLRRPCWGRRLALLPQEPWLALDPTMRALPQVVETHRFVAGRTTRDATQRAAHDLARLGLADAAQKYPFMLSGGMAQRVAFAATCAGGASVLIVDEPTKGLDAELRDQIVALLREVLAGGGAVLTITHDVAVARALGGQIAVMRDGRILEWGPALRVLEHPQHSYTRELLAAEPAAWPSPVAQPSVAGAPLIEARGLTKRYGKRPLFERLDLTLQPGERVAIQGPSGSGKTTVGNILLGLVAPDAGSVAYRRDVDRIKLQKLYQDPSAAFAPKASLRRSLLDLTRLHRLSWQPVERLMGQLRLASELLDRWPHQVSGGELQRFALLRVLLLQPAFVFADEPTSRLDPLNQRETIHLMLSALAEAGSTLVLVTHDPDLSRKVAGRTIHVDAAIAAPHSTRLSSRPGPITGCAPSGRR